MTTDTSPLPNLGVVWSKYQRRLDAGLKAVDAAIDGGFDELATSALPEVIVTASNLQSGLISLG